MREGVTIVAAAAAVVAVVVVGPYALNPPAVPGGAPSHDLAQNVAAARLIAAGRGADLYDQSAEYAERVALVGPEPSVTFPPGVPFVSPPWRAVLYLPVVWLPFTTVAAAHRVVLLGALAAAMYLMRRWLPVPWPVAWALTAATPASLGGLQAGQTTHLSLLAWVGAARLVDAGRPSWAALALGLASFKPDLVWPGTVVLALRGGWRGAALGLGAVYLVSAAVSRDLAWGWTWWQSATTAVVAYTGPVAFVRPGLALAALMGGAWLNVPSCWRGRATLLLPIASLAATPYHWGYDDLIAAGAVWLAAGLVVALSLRGR